MDFNRPNKTIIQTKIIARVCEMSNVEIIPSIVKLPYFPPAIGVIFPAPVIAPIVAAAKFANEP